MTPTLPFDSSLSSIKIAVKEWDRVKMAGTDFTVFDEGVEEIRVDYRGALGARRGVLIFPDHRDVMDVRLSSAEALMGAPPLLRTLTLDCSIQSAHRIELVSVLLPMYVTQWARNRLAETQATGRKLALNRAEELIVAEEPDRDDPATLLEVARILLDRMALDYFGYALGEWQVSRGGPGKPAGKQAKAVSVALEQLWREELAAPYLCIFTQAFWVNAQQKTPSKAKLLFKTPVVLKKPGSPLYHFANVLLEIIESPIWVATETAHMLKRAWSGNAETIKLERLALATAMKAVFMRRFPVDTVFTVNCLGKNGKFTNSGHFWIFK